MQLKIEKDEISSTDASEYEKSLGVYMNLLLN